MALVSQASETVAQLQEMFNKEKNITEDNKLRVNEWKAVDIFLLLSDP